MDNVCCFYPDRLRPGIDDVCGNVATRQVFLNNPNHDDGCYVWVCEDCMDEAIKWWEFCDLIVEF